MKIQNRLFYLIIFPYKSIDYIFSNFYNPLESYLIQLLFRHNPYNLIYFKFLKFLIISDRIFH